jgi:hypothetical protein
LRQRAYTHEEPLGFGASVHPPPPGAVAAAWRRRRLSITRTPTQHEALPDVLDRDD